MFASLWNVRFFYQKLVHNMETISQFAAVMLRAPSSIGEVPISLEQLAARKVRNGTQKGSDFVSAARLDFRPCLSERRRLCMRYNSRIKN